MPDLTRIVAAALLAALAAGAASAQQEAAEEPATEATESTKTGGAEATTTDTMGLSMGEEAEEVGQTYTAEVFGEWERRCIRTEQGNDPCQLYQLLQDDEGNNVAEISMFALPEAQEAAAGATIITPLETLLTGQVSLSVDGGAARRYPFTFCSQVGCFSRIGFTEAEVQQFKRGREATISIRPLAAPDQTVDLTVSLSGFTAGYDSVAEANAAAGNN
ncbi:invasion associated locus B family protein [Roseitranquillus sediminis]|uniref:invasion associated locus B family protein n=1 Tax=Roseitranquillus sediminis TaxID=2809051 RepID=UPI001D0CD034|nr:invasion associated locus B family protein [Roseitranquillus sediminis]MBM9593973.1 invasion associated locus B family protein [Roseitranquillus sediminis]